jgi:HK97 family phage portal protein
MTNSANIARARLGDAIALDHAVRAAVDAQTSVVKAMLPEGVTVSSSDVRMGSIFGAQPTDAGASVTEQSAMRVTTVYACVRLIAGTIATLPWHVYRRDADGDREKIDHDVWWLLNESATPRFTSAAMWMAAILQTLLRGDGIVLIDRPSIYSDRIRGLIPLRREHVQPFVTSAGDVAYRVFDPEADGGKGAHFTVPSNDVLHFTGDFFNGLTSLSVLQTAARQSVGIALRADQHAARAFGDGAYLQHVLKAPKSMGTKQQEELRAAFVARYSGGPGASPIPLVLTEGMEIDSISLTPADQQLLETRRWGVVDIARAFGCPPHMVGETEKNTSWGTGIEQLYLGFLRGQLPLITRVRQELNRKLFSRAGTFIDPDLEALTAGDLKTQADYFQRALGGPGAQGWMAVDEVRRKTNMKALGGDFAKVGKAGAAPAPAKDAKAPDKAPDSTQEPGDGAGEPAPAE